ncbi:MAG TPA: selenocysteine-specific translation elongation factor [Jatrophihabitans sp.]|nr:selenocysteine-specific translation elongation factor [Jatrophihabitans sp.]
MRVLATAGHVDHGKSTLVRALTGMEPDRWAEERRRGMTIDLGFGWLELPSGEPVAFVDVPGHQRFVPNMLAGVGPVPAVLLVVAGDQGWGRQTSEHLDAITALGISHGLLAITRTDLAATDRVAEVLSDAQARLASSSLAEVESVLVSAATGQGMADLSAAIGRLVDRLPSPVTDGRVRLWVDRAFSMTGAGTVLTGTLGAGRLVVGQELQLAADRYPIRGLQALGRPVDQVGAVARVAVNLRGLDRARVGRGDCLLSPDAWWSSDSLDVRLRPVLAEPAGELVLHLGSAAIPVRLRRLDAEHVRLRLARPVPVQVGDRGLLRDPAQRQIVAGVQVLDPDPPRLDRRGAAAVRAVELASGVAASLSGQVRRRGAVRRNVLEKLGIPLRQPADVLERGEWLVDPAGWQRWRDELVRAVDRQAAADPRRPWLPVEAARQQVGIPDQALARAAATEAGLDWSDGRLARPGSQPSVGTAAGPMAVLLQRLANRPFDAPERPELAEQGIGPRELAVAAKAGQLLRLAPDLVVAADAAERAVQVLEGLPQPFTLSQARQALGATRRVAVPLLEHLDRLRLTVRVDASHRTLR